MADKKYANRYWEQNGDCHELHFTQFYDDEAILKFTQDKEDSETFWYISDLLKVEHDCIFADSVDDAMEEFEDMVIGHIQDEIDYYEEMLEKFNAEE